MFIMFIFGLSNMVRLQEVEDQDDKKNGGQ